MKKLACILCFAVIFISCDRLDSEHETEPKEFKLGSLQKILDGYVVNSIAFDSKGNAWIGTQGKGLIQYNKQKTIVYDYRNSELPKDLWIWDIAVDKNDNVWIGASDGVWKYDGKDFIRYNSQNTAMPEDIVWSIAVDSKNNIWMASCRFRQGGLVKYDGNQWTTYTPNNSVLPVNSIKGISIDRSDNVWLALGEYVTQSYLVKISNDKWDVYDENDFGFKPYYLGGIQCDNKNRVLVSISYMLSSTMGPHFPYFFIFDGKNTTQLTYGDNISLSKITTNCEDNVLCFGGVWIGKQWRPIDFNFDFNGSEYIGNGVWTIEKDVNHRIWVGTESGIYIAHPSK